MTTFQHPESPYKSNNTASNMAGFTLMNNQVGAVVAQVLAKKPNVKVTYLPSMIRVDGTGMFELDYDEVSEALGYEPGYLDPAVRSKPMYSAASSGLANMIVRSSSWIIRP